MRFAARVFVSLLAPALAPLLACGGTEAPLVAGADAEVDASLGADAALTADGGAADSQAPPGCGEFAGDVKLTCAKDGNARGKCPDGATAVVEACPRGCLRMPSTEDDVCMGTADTFSCTGSYGTTRSTSGDYYITAFGCWLDADGGAHTDPADNCIPACLAKAKADGLCLPGDTGPQCEERVTWYTADGARFGCLARLRVTNPANGKSVIAVALDFGPGCSGETAVSHEVLDSSGRVDRYLFGADQGRNDKALVHVVEVDRATPLGPVP